MVVIFADTGIMWPSSFQAFCTLVSRQSLTIVIAIAIAIRDDKKCEHYSAITNRAIAIITYRYISLHIPICPYISLNIPIIIIIIRQTSRCPLSAVMQANRLIL